VVGTGRFELPTCRLGGGRSIQLSYVPTGRFIVPWRRESRCRLGLIIEHIVAMAVTSHGVLGLHMLGPRVHDFERDDGSSQQDKEQKV